MTEREKLKLARGIILDVFQDNKEVFKEALDKSFKQNPIGFYTKIIHPLMPKELSVEHEVVNHSDIVKQLESKRVLDAKVITIKTKD
jgi:hypothetical protein